MKNGYIHKMEKEWKEVYRCPYIEICSVIPLDRCMSKDYHSCDAYEIMKAKRGGVEMP
jgi:hypothetical protein